MVSVRLRDGQTIRGIAKSESTFELVLLGMDGQLHRLSKDHLAEIVRESALNIAAVVAGRDRI